MNQGLEVESFSGNYNMAIDDANEKAFKGIITTESNYYSRIIFTNKTLKHTFTTAVDGVKTCFNRCFALRIFTKTDALVFALLRQN
jgi:hypothetical protein